MANIDEIKDRLVEELYSRGETSYKIAKKVGTSPTMVREWKRKRSAPGAYYLAVMLEAGVDVVYILTGKRNE